MYDVLVMCILKAIHKWNPYYTDGVRKVVDVIDTCFPSRKQFTAYQLNTALNGALGFDGTRIMGLLARRGFCRRPAACTTAPDGFPPAGKRRLPMKSLRELVSVLQQAQGMLEPVLASLHQQDESELFLAVAPGIARDCYRLVREGLRQAVEWRWFTGRRGRTSKLLVDVLGCLQGASEAAGWAEAERRMAAAAWRLEQAVAGLGVPPSRTRLRSRSS